MAGQDRHLIIGVHVDDRTQQASDLQGVLSKYGAYIKTRLGLHEAKPDFSSTTGVILLEMLDNEAKRAAMVEELNAIPGVDTKEMIFEH